jgi:ribonuclease III
MKRQRRKMIMESKKIEKKLGLKFKNPELLKQALIHRSYLNENRGEELRNNERLEFLGDAVLELIISANLFVKFPNKTEGELTAIRSAIVRTESLAEESRRLDIGKHLLMSKGEKDSGGEDKDFILANTYEALLGAIYLDQGIEECKKFVERTVLKKLPRIISEELFIDPKTKIQELVQAKYKVTPTYRITKEQGPDHDKSFTVVLEVGNKLMAEGSGLSKQKAEEEAAQKAIDILEKK